VGSSLLSRPGSDGPHILLHSIWRDDLAPWICEKDPQNATKRLDLAIKRKKEYARYGRESTYWIVVLLWILNGTTGKTGAISGKHGVIFLEAALIFQGPTLEKVDNRQDYGEERVISLGVVKRRVLHVVYTMRGNKRRIVSARKSDKHEREAYRHIYP
jgi:uncharacterized protein